MPHQCTTCGRTFPDGSKEMLSGCPDCGGNKFQFQPSDRPSSEEQTDSPPEPSSPPDPPTESIDDGVAGTVAEAAETVRDWVGGEDTAGPTRQPTEETASKEPGTREWPAVGRRDPDGDPTRRSADEDTAQASARTDVVDPDDLPNPEASSREDRGETTARTEQTDSPQQPPDDATSGTDASSPEGVDTQAETDSSPFTGAGSAERDSPDLDELREELNEQFESIRIVSPGQYELNLMELYDRDEYIISLMEDGRYAIEVPEAWRDET